MTHTFFTGLRHKVGGNVPRGTVTPVTVLFGLVILVLFIAGCGPKEKKPEFRVGMDLSYPPFETIDEKGQPAGISVEIAKALAEKLNLPLRIEAMPFVGLIPALQTGRVDCVISSMTATDERRKTVAFSEPYLTIGLAMLVNSKSTVKTLQDLDQPGKTVVVRPGTTAEIWARRYITQAQMLAVEKEGPAVLEVIQGKADAFIYDQMSVWQNAQKNPDTTRAILEPIQTENWAIALRQNEPLLLEAVNEFLKEYRAQGGFNKLGEKYLKDQKKVFEEQGIPFYF
jgi:polar amino acid transport system substrate-binding protein